MRGILAHSTRDPGRPPPHVSRKIAAMIPAVVLAAGLSTRMGRAKALLPIDDETFIERIVHSFIAAGVRMW